VRIQDVLLTDLELYDTHDVVGPANRKYTCHLLIEAVDVKVGASGGDGQQEVVVAELGVVKVAFPVDAQLNRHVRLPFGLIRSEQEQEQKQNKNDTKNLLPFLHVR
jgi:hypothetical protein